jgi:nucleotide-binding universal stress UspA family protein
VHGADRDRPQRDGNRRINPSMLGRLRELALETDQPHPALRAADAAVRATRMQVKVETAVVRGGSRVELLHESREAAMKCVGSVGAGQVDDLPVGSTATTLANTAYCPVAIMRPHSQTPPPNPGWIIVARR